MTDRPTVTGLRLAPVLALVGLAALAGCGSGDPTAAEQPADPGDPILAFHQCLRDGGLDVPDPDPGGPINLGGNVDTDDPATMQIVQTCGQTHLAAADGRVTVGGNGGNMGDNLASPEALIAFVDCLRGHGFDMPDPSPDGRLSLPEGLDPQQADFQNAARECSPLLEGGGLLIGDGDGGGMVTQR